MKKVRKLTVLTAFALSAVLLMSGCSAGGSAQKDTSAVSSGAENSGEQAEAAAQPSASAEADNIPAYVDDFYNAVNHDTLAGWEIPKNEADISWFQIADEDNYNKVNELIQKASSETGQEKSSDLYNIRALNLTGLDKKARNSGGYGSIAGTYLKEVDEAQTVETLLKACIKFQKDYGYYSLMGFQYMGDSQDSSVKVLYVYNPDTGLRREDWFSEDETSKMRVDEYKKYLAALHENSGLNAREAADTVDRVTSMMMDLASSALKAEELYDAEKTYNVYMAKDAAALYSAALPVDILKEIYEISDDEKTIVQEPELCRKLGGYLTEENLPLLKEYVKTCLYSDLSSLTDLASLEAAQEFHMAVNGIEEKKTFDRNVSEKVQQYLGYECGRIYCETYFDESAKQDVEAIVRQIIDVYDQRLGDMEWMEENTRNEARKKLASMVIKVGYPDQWPQDKYSLSLTSPEDGGLFVDNVLTISKAEQDYAFETRHDPVDREEWGMTPQTVNAYYNPGNNEIVFPAGILCFPFYNADAKPVANLGGIGTVIGHEITHAFDTNGSQYDEKGNLRDWWTAKDKEKFNELSQKVIDYYDTMKVNGMNVNGTLTVTENIADLGAVSCITEIAKQKGYDLRELYEAYAVIWASKYRDEYLSYIMTNDYHSPGITRINAVLSAVDDFYTAYGVKEGDGMYQKPEDRPKIW